MHDTWTFRAHDTRMRGHLDACAYHESRLERQSLRRPRRPHVVPRASRPCPVTRRLSIPSMASSIAMRACPAPCHATRAGRHAGASRRPTSSASSVSVVARAVNAGETSGKATEDGKPVPPALTSEVRVDATEAVTRYARVDDASVRGRGGGGRVPSHSRGGLARA